MQLSLKPYPKPLTPASFQAICDAAEQQSEVIYQHVGGEHHFNLPQQLGNGRETEIYLRKGISLVIRDVELWQTIQLENHFNSSPPLISKFHLSGNSRVLTPDASDISSDYTEVVGCNYLYHLPEIVELEEWYQEKIQLVMILIQLERLQEFDQDCECLPQPLRQLIAGNSTVRFHQPLGTTTVAMNQVLQQILYCPYQGMMKQLYLDGKALELLALQFAQWLEVRQQAVPFRLRPDDTERLHHARDILVQQMDNPPSLLELARQVGIDDCKLKWGFRLLFGTTVFGYLHDVRMERSRQLLETGQMSVTEVAYTVGYSSLSSFSKAFRKKFGSSPLRFTSTRLYNTNVLC